MKFSLPLGLMSSKTKKKKKSLKLKNLEIWWIATFPQNLALIFLTVSEKMHFMDGRMTDARAMAKNQNTNPPSNCIQIISDYPELSSL